MSTTEAKVRNSIRIHDTTVLTTGQITQAIADAETRIAGQTDDEIAIRYFTCWILASDIAWDKVKSTSGISFEKPNPEKFWEQYLFRRKELGLAAPKKINWNKVDTVEY